MSHDDSLNEVRSIRLTLASGLSNLAEWNKVAPTMQQAYDDLGWVEKYMSQTPGVAKGLVSEELTDYAISSARTLRDLITVPAPSPNLYPVLNTTSGSAPYAYEVHVRSVGQQFRGNEEVSTWTANALTERQQMQAVKDRSAKARRRLTQLHPSLEDLHKQAVDAALRAKSSAPNPVEAAQFINRVLEQFKGHLANLCKSGSGATYQRIADNLAANSELTKMVVRNGQETYNTLNKELVDIRKWMGERPPGERLMEILEAIEYHIVNVTDALDSDKLGFKLSD